MSPIRDSWGEERDAALPVRPTQCFFLFRRINMDRETDYIKVQPKRFAPRANKETADGKFFRRLRFLDFERQYVPYTAS